MNAPATVLLTDRAWPDDAIERQIIEAAGLRLVCGPAVPAAQEVIEALARQHRPAAIMTCWARVSAEAIAASPALRLVTRMGVGLDNIAVDTATARGVWVSNVPDYCVEEVSDHAVGFALAWTRGIVALDREVRAGRWHPAGASLRRLSTLTCGLVGVGRIGQATARKLSAFGCRLLAHTRRGSDGAPPDVPGLRFTDLDTLLAQSDIVILHAPLTPATQHLINAARLAQMKPGSLLINASRGGLVDSTALADALASGHLGGAALDVLESEPQVPDALRQHPRTVLTPHVAFTSDASLAELRRRAAEEVVAVLAGQPPRHACNQPVAG